MTDMRSLDDVVARLRAGVPMMQVARDLGIGADKLFGFVQVFEIVTGEKLPRARKGKKLRFSLDDLASAYRASKRGDLKRLAHSFGISYTTLNYHLRRYEDETGQMLPRLKRLRMANGKAA